MSAPASVATITCPSCGGDGVRERGSIRDDLSYQTATCGRCGGAGRVEVERPRCTCDCSQLVPGIGSPSCPVHARPSSGPFWADPGYP